MNPEARCINCGHPMCDHVRLRYFWRPWISHTIGRILGRIEDTTEGIW